KQGFLDQLENIITEFKRYEITPEILRLQQDHLNQYIHKEPGEVALANKLEDLIYIYEKLMQSLQDNYIDSEDQLQLLAEKINDRSEEHTSELQSRFDLVCRLLLEKKKKKRTNAKSTYIIGVRIKMF